MSELVALRGAVSPANAYKVDLRVTPGWAPEPHNPAGKTPYFSPIKQIGPEHATRTPCCLARPEGVEPPTYGSVVRRSIQLSYGRTSRASRLGEAHLLF